MIAHLGLIRIYSTVVGTLQNRYRTIQRLYPIDTILTVVSLVSYSTLQLTLLLIVGIVAQAIGI